MQKKSPIKENILLFIDYKGISKYKFYQDTGIARGILDAKGGMTEDTIAKFIAQYPEVNINWLLTGKGEMLDNRSSVIQNTGNDQKPTTIPPKNTNETIDALKEVISAQKQLIDMLKTENNTLKEQLKK